MKKKEWKPSKRFKENLQKLFSDGKITVMGSESENTITIKTDRFRLVVKCTKGLEIEEI